MIGYVNAGININQHFLFNRFNLINVNDNIIVKIIIVIIICFVLLSLFSCRSNGSNQLLSAVTSLCRFIMRTDNRATVRVSSTDRRMAVRRIGMPFRWIPRGHPMVNHRIHIYVDIGRPLFGC